MWRFDPAATPRRLFATVKIHLTKGVTTPIILPMTVDMTALAIYQACVCLGVQKAARATARRYDEALRPLGITSGQFSILSSLLSDRVLPMTTWADLLGVDRTTLKRNLVPLEEAGWIETTDGS